MGAATLRHFVVQMLATVQLVGWQSRHTHRQALHALKPGAPHCPRRTILLFDHNSLMHFIIIIARAPTLYKHNGMALPTCVQGAR